MSIQNASRKNMMDGQVLTNHIIDARIIEALSLTPRELFVPKAFEFMAYSDADTPLLVSPEERNVVQRYMLEPMVFARMLQMADIQPTDRVLLIGSGSGYEATILSQLAARVCALECDEVLASRTKAALREMNIRNVDVVLGDLVDGYMPSAPYSVIFINGGMEIDVPEALVDQLVEGGRLVSVMSRAGVGEVTLFTRYHDALSSWVEYNTSPRILPGFESPKEFLFA